MTQTIRNVTQNSENHISVDIYYHPNNSHASIEDSQSRYCFTVYADKFDQDDLATWVKDSIDFDNEDAVDELHDIINAFAKAAVEGFDYIWKCSAENGHDDYLEFHPFKNDAEHSLTSQMC